MNLFILLPISVLLSWVLAGLIRRYALSHNLMDVPNLRSSHSIPTPRGGGVAFIIPFLLLTPVLAIKGDLPLPAVLAIWGSGILVSYVSFLDDHKHVAAHWRLLAHFVSAGWVLFWLEGFPPLPIFGFIIDMGWAGSALGAVYLVWLLNLYNFMDGIDGIASIEAITVCVGATILTALQTSSQHIWLTPLLLAASVGGFLFWNFPPAKLFMGDVGSSFLGLMVGLLSIQVTWLLPQMFWVWTILLGVFIVDATLTLLRRSIKGEIIYEAHSSHTYQIVARHYHSHKIVSLFTGLINLCWLLPIGYVVSKQWIDGFMGVIIAYTPLVGLFIFFTSKQNREET